MSRPVDADLATVLEASGLGLIRPPTAGANLFLGTMPEDDDATVPDRCVSLLMSGGGGAAGFVGNTRETYRRVTCLVQVRGPREDHSNGQALALSVMDALHLVTASPYTLVAVRESAPLYAGVDSADRPRWSMTVVAEYSDAGAGASPPISLSDPGDRTITGNLTVTGNAELRGNVQPEAGDRLELRGRPVDGAAAVGTDIDTESALATAGALLVRLLNAGVLKGSVDKDGALRCGLGVPAFDGATNGAALIFELNKGISFDGAVYNGAVYPHVYYNGTFIVFNRHVSVGGGSSLEASGGVQGPFNGSLSLTGRMFSSETAKGTILDAQNSLTHAGARIVEVTNAGVRKFSLTKDGFIQWGAAGGPIDSFGSGAPTAADPNGSTYRRTDGTGPNFYVRENGAWVAK